MNWELFGDVTQHLLDGFTVTLEIFALTLLMALPLGLLIAFGSMSKFKPLAYLTKIFVWIIRGVPLMLQVIVVFYVPGFLLGTPIFTRFSSVIAAVVINYACYFSEIYRGGIEGIPRGQYEAGMVLGMTRGQIFFRVVLPQVVKRILAPIANEVITLVKDTALARVIMVVELIQAAQDYAAFGLMWPLFYTAVYYLIFTALLTFLFRWIEKKLDYIKC